MTLPSASFWTELESRLAKFNLLCHPFYQAWSAGSLTRDDLREYAADYYHHVAAFPAYLSAFHSRLDDGELRRAVLRNLCDEEIEGTAHSDLWLQFAEGMGGSVESVRESQPAAEVSELIGGFRQIASEGSKAEALAAFYAYESQVPRVAKAKFEGLKEMYGADDRTCAYFKLHQTADVHHSRVWRDLLEKELTADPAAREQALSAAENTAAALWNALSGIEAKRQKRLAA